MPLDARVPLAAVAGPMIDLGKKREDAARLADVLQTQQMRQKMFDHQEQQRQREQKTWQREDQREQIFKKNAKAFSEERYGEMLEQLMEVDPVWTTEYKANLEIKQKQYKTAAMAQTEAERQQTKGETEDLGNAVLEIWDFDKGALDPSRYPALFESLKASGNRAVAMLPTETITDPETGEQKTVPKFDETRLKALLFQVPAIRTELQKASDPVNVTEGGQMVRDRKSPSGWRKITPMVPVPPAANAGGDAAGQTGQPGQGQWMPAPSAKPVDYGVPVPYSDAYIKDVAKLPPGAALSESQQRDMQARYSASRRDPPNQQSNGVSETRRLMTFNSIANNYQRSPLIRAADRTIILGDAVKAIEANPTDPAAQLNLAYGYIQALDTYMSAVREGELQNLGILGTQLENLRVTVNRVATEGAFMPKEVAKNVAASSKRLINVIESGRDNKEKEFASQANVSEVGDMWTRYVDGFRPTTSKPKTDQQGDQPSAQLKAWLDKQEWPTGFSRQVGDVVWTKKRDGTYMSTKAKPKASQ